MLVMLQKTNDIRLLIYLGYNPSDEVQEFKTRAQATDAQTKDDEATLSNTSLSDVAPPINPIKQFPRAHQDSSTWSNNSHALASHARAMSSVPQPPLLLRPLAVAPAVVLRPNANAGQIRPRQPPTYI